MHTDSKKDHLSSIDGPNYGIYKLPSYQLDSLIYRLSERDLQNQIGDLETKDKILIYYRVSKLCKRKLMRVFSSICEQIKKLEKQHSYLPKVENLMIFNSKITFEQLMKLIDLSNSNTFVKEFIALEDDYLKCLGLIYATDIISNYNVHQKSYIHSSLNRTKMLKIDQFNEDGDISMTEEELESYHRLIVIDSNDRILGSIETERVLDQHDVFMKPNGMLYATPKQDIKRIVVMLSTGIVGTLICTLMSMAFHSGEKGLCMLMMIKCINDTVALIVIEDQISEESFYRYYKPMIFITSLISSLVFYLIFSDKKIILHSMLSINIACILLAKFTQFLYKHNRNFGIVPILLIPEIISPTAIFIISKLT